MRSRLTLSSERLRVVRSVYGGKALATLQLNRMPAVVSLRSRSFASGDSATRNCTD